MSDDGISVFGLGKVGATLVAALTAASYRVIGVDVNAALVRSLNDGSFRTSEPGVIERLARLTVGQFRATTRAEEAVANSAVSFIIVPTPANSLGGFSNRYVERSLEGIGRAAARKHGRHVVAVISTVLPRSSRIQLIPALERAAGRRIGDRLGYCYSPSFLGSDLKVFSPKIRQLYATGDAANLVTMPNEPKPCSGSSSASPTNALDMCAEQTANLTGERRALVFSTATNIGLKVGFTGQVPSSIKFGFDRGELSIIPLHSQTTVDKPDKYTSVLASIDMNLDTPSMKDADL
jgi:hypothetical protein